MSNRAFLIYGGILFALVVGQVITLVHLRQRSWSATLECRATNAGRPLAATDVRVFVYVAGRDERLVASGDLRERLVVPGGTYDVRVVYLRAADGQERWLRNVSVAPRERAIHEVDFAAGQLSVDASVATLPAEPAQIDVQIYAAGDRDRLISAIRSGRPVLLGAGTYDLRVVLIVEGQEKQVRWLEGVVVRAGLHERPSVDFLRGTLLVRARNAGDALPGGSVRLAVHRAGDVQRELLDEGWADLPLGLPTGRYDVEAVFTSSSDRPSRWLRGVEIVEGTVVERLVEFDSATLTIGARLVGGELLGGFSVYVYYYAAGDHRQPLAYTSAGDPAILAAGRYDVRAEFFRSHDRPNLWLREIVLAPGEVRTESLTFRSARLLVRAYDRAGQELVGDEVFLHVHAAGQRDRAIATARSGEELVLSEGAYDIRVEDTLHPAEEVWLGAVSLSAGDARVERLTVPGRPPTR